MLTTRLELATGLAERTHRLARLAGSLLIRAIRSQTVRIVLCIRLEHLVIDQLLRWHFRLPVRY